MRSTVQVRIDPKQKQAVKRILEKLGLDFSAAIQLYFHQILAQKGLPFRPLTENGFTPEQETFLLRESEGTMQQLQEGTLRTYATAKDMFDDIMRDEA
ncbi:MAG: type II toxin-antitoxin system RelB/DinJ family antitoxin [Patescibacteria group bacterium]